MTPPSTDVDRTFVLRNHWRLWGVVAEEFETSDEWITERTGIKSRFFADDDVATSDLAADATISALTQAGILVDEIDGLFVATVSPDHHTTPPTVSLIADKIGIKGRWPDGTIRPLRYFDGSAACCSFITVLEQAYNAVMLGHCQVALVVGADKMSTTNSRYSRNLYPILSDGAAALILTATERAKKQPLPQFFGSIDGSLAPHIMNEYGGSAKPLTAKIVANPFDQRHLMAMAGPTVMRWALETLLPNPKTLGYMDKAFISVALESFGHRVLSMDSLGEALNCYQLIALHQANKRVTDNVEGFLIKAGYRGVFHNILETQGNPSSAAIPLVMHSAHEAGDFNPGTRVLAVTFGGGGTMYAGDFTA